MLVDIGVNFTSKRFDKDLDETVQRAVSSGVEKIIITGTSVDDSLNAALLSNQFSNVCYSTAGIHPHNAKEFDENSLMQLSTLLERNQVVAVGECGLDFNRNFSEPKDQLICFEAQLELAVEKQKPVFLHQRDAHDDFIQILSRYINKIPRAVAHCFTGNQKELDAYLEMGLSIGITGWVCDERRGQELRSIVNRVPLDRLMIETDAPYLLPRDLRPKPKSSRNEPMYLPHVCQVVANCYGEPYEVIEKQSYQNSIHFFDLE